MTAVMQNVLQREIMVAESVKSYPYPALLPLTQQGINSYSCTTSCSSALLPQALQHQSYSSHSPIPRMDRNGTEGRSLSSSVGPPMDPNEQGPNMPTPSGLGAGGMHNSTSPSSMLKDSIFAQRKQREFIPDNKKDDCYWDRRRRNNEAAKRSREKRRFNDMVLEQRVLELSKENYLLRAQVTAFENKFHVKGEGLVNEEQVIASMPQADQILALTRRPNMPTLDMPSPPSLLSPPSLPSSPPPPASTNLAEEEQYAIPQYAQHQHLEHPTSMRSHSPPQPTSMRSHSPPQPTSMRSHSPPPPTNMRSHSPPHPTSIRSHSPDLYHRDSQPSYSPESQNFYETTALNLSARSSRSPVNMDYCDDRISRSTDYSGLPHKLRHKTNHHNSHTATLTNHLNSISSTHHHLRPQSTSPLREQLPPLTATHHYQRSPSPHRNNSHHIHQHHHQSVPHNLTGRSSSPRVLPSSSTHIHYPVKTEPIPRDVGEESPGSSDDRDSGISLTSSPTLPGETNYPPSNRDSTEDMECDSDQQLRAELNRLATEVRSLKHILNQSVVDPHRNMTNGTRR
uniref:Nuclear factor interleukin-3-regulated protein-like n=3 Tax=Hirondellea gigas TaxID=1518452 RepID=A0A6A7G345_9CRUS